jgi:hypothetical protein
VAAWRCLLEPVPLLHLRVGRIDRAHILLAEPPVHLVEMLADDLLLGIRDAPTVRLARVFKAGVVGLAPDPARRLSVSAWPPSSPPWSWLAGAARLVLLSDGPHEDGLHVLGRAEPVELAHTEGELLP